MSNLIRTALVQLNSSDNIAANITAASQFVREASAQGATLVVLPENAVMMAFGREKILAQAKTEADHPAIPAFADLAKQLSITLVIGSLAILQEDGLIANRCYVFGPEGKILARYTKIHLFDATLPSGENYRESATFEAGNQAQWVDCPAGRLGLSICYDLRFPHLYRQYAKAGAELLTIPAAFTKITGEAHWHVLMRARAIENGCFVLAPAQCGTHDGGRQTFGHSLIVDPWGVILADGGKDPGVVVADLDKTKIQQARAALPCLTHDRDFEMVGNT